MEPQSPAPKKAAWKIVWEFVRFAVLVVVIVLGVRMFIAQPFIVSGTSMVPTFHNKNYLIIDEISYRFSEPKRGDVVVFKPPYDNGIYLIKRVIGLPGETVSIRGGIITITNAEHPEGLTLDETYVTNGSAGEDHTTTLADGKYFVMGDNRPASYDSRKWGALPRENITGRALLRLYPFNQISVFPGAHPHY